MIFARRREHDLARAGIEVRLQLARAVLRSVRYDLSAMGVPMQACGTWKKDGVPLHQVSFHFWQECPTKLEHSFTPGSWELELQLGFGGVQCFPFLVSADEVGREIEIKVVH